MKKDIHPKYHAKAKIACACGNSFEVGSTVEDMKTETCSACHPLYTGKKKVMDTTGRVDRFKKLTEKAAGKKVTKKPRAEKKAAAEERTAKPAKTEKKAKK